MKLCKICGNPAIGRQLCSAHYTQFRREGILSQHAVVQIQNIPFNQCYEIAENGCWNWTRAMLRTGYGSFRRDGKLWRAHRYSYTQTKGPIPAGLDLMHSCDNRKCVNPDHLTPGTRKENMQDAKLKGRLPSGEKSSRAKLTMEKANQIRELCKTMLQKDVAPLFGINRATVSAIVNRYEVGGWNK